MGEPRLTHRSPATDEIVQFRTDSADTTHELVLDQLVGSAQRGLAMTVSGRVGRIVSERGARTPVTVAVVSPLALTSRERETATLVSKGLSNNKKDVADATTMSARTVEGHVHPTCSQLGVASRVELAHLM